MAKAPRSSSVAAPNDLSKRSLVLQPHSHLEIQVSSTTLRLPPASCVLVCLLIVAFPVRHHLSLFDCARQLLASPRSQVIWATRN